MLPIERFKKSVTEDNLWIYVLTLGKGQEIANEDVPRLVFEKYGFLPGGFLTARVLFRLRQQGFTSNEKHLGKNAFKTTPLGAEQLKQAQSRLKEILEKLSK